MSHSRRGSSTCLGTTLMAIVAFALTYVGGGGSTPEAPRTEGRISLAPVARGEIDWGYDADGDGLSDEMEKFAGSNMFVADTDGDGFGDGAEWVLRGNPIDAAAVPVPWPSVRTYAYEVGDRIRVSCTVFPADPRFYGGFRLLVGSPEFVISPHGDPGSGVGIYDVTSWLATLAGAYTETTFLGLSCIGFHFDLERSLLEQVGRMNIAAVATLANVTVVDQICLGVEGATHFVLAAGPVDPGGGGALTTQPLPPIPPPDDEVPEYCAVTLSEGKSVGLASIEYEVTDAGCEPGGLLYCIDADCTALAGQTILLIDYGYLNSLGQ